MNSRDLIRKGLEDLEGWCWEEKAERMYDLIRQEQPDTLVEVGVYGGRSLVPMLVGARDNGKGWVYGVDAWDNDVATTVPYGEDNNTFWANDDLGRVKTKLYRFLAEHDLARYGHILELSGEEALPLFRPKSIDFLHIDASHSVLDEARDVTGYLMKLKTDGILIIDDTDRDDVQPALEIALTVCDAVYVNKKYVVLRKRI